MTPLEICMSYVLVRSADDSFRFGDISPYYTCLYLHRDTHLHEVLPYPWGLRKVEVPYSSDEIFSFKTAVGSRNEWTSRLIVSNNIEYII